ncbi:MAG: ABC transporter permease [Actinomycetia bacterium]|nr:ABC transporter permease [Actinomycetes bacterium]
MRGALTVYRKELADYFSSKIFIILLAVIYIIGLGFVYIAIQNIKAAPTSTDQNLLIKVFIDEFIYLKLFTVGQILNFNFVSFLGIFLPLIGILFGFDAINSERNSGNLSRLLSQPIYRDSVINGKFLAGITTITIMISSVVFIIIGIGIRSIGVPPTSEEILRIFVFIIVCIIYGTFWMSLSMLFSVIMKNTAASILTAIPIWIFLVFFWGMVAKAIADAVFPTGDTATNAQIISNSALWLNIQRISPQFLFLEAVLILINPTLQHILLRPVTSAALNKMLFNPLSMSQSFVQVWPQLLTIIALAFICFALSYVIFMKQEIRST